MTEWEHLHPRSTILLRDATLPMDRFLDPKLFTAEQSERTLEQTRLVLLDMVLDEQKQCTSKCIVCGHNLAELEYLEHVLANDTLKMCYDLRQHRRKAIKDRFKTRDNWVEFCCDPATSWKDPLHTDPNDLTHEFHDWSFTSCP